MNCKTSIHNHESLIEASGNSFFIDAIKRVNRVHQSRKRGEDRPHGYSTIVP